MADDDNKIVIDVDADTSSAQQKIDDFAEHAQKSLGKATASASGGRGDSGGDNGGKTRYINVEREVLGESAEGAGESTADIRLFREALHALHPALAEAGIGLGELSALVSAARGGVIALAGAIAGLFVTALEKAGDAANEAANKIGAFSSKGFAGGKEQYGALSETANQLQTPTSGLVDPFLEATRLNQQQPSQNQLPNKDLLDAISNLVKGGQTENGGDASKVLEAATKFFSDGREKGIFGPDDFKVLEGIAPKMAALIEDKLPKGQSSFTGAQVLGAIKGAGPQIDANAIAAQAEQPETISAAWSKVKAAYERFEENAPHGDAIAQGLDKLADFFTSVGSARKRYKDFAEAQEKAPHEFTALDPRVQENLRADNERPRRPDRRGLDDSGYVAFDAENTGRLAPETEKATTTADNATSVFSQSLQKKLDEFHLKPEDAFAAKSTDLNLRQATIEKKYEPAETASKLEHAEIALQSANINLQNAVINGLEAQKNKELSALAPEEGSERVKSAESRLRKADHKFNQTHGLGDFGYNQALEDRSDSEDELDAARTALKRARIEKKYSYLEEPKADLAAQQAQTAIRSAELEKRDASLRFAKEGETGPVSHELQQLKYSEALLKEQEQQNKYQGEAVSILKDILSALNNKQTPKGQLEDKDDQRQNEQQKEQPQNEQQKESLQNSQDSSSSKSASQDYETNAHKTGFRTVEGDQAAREKAQAQGKNYGNEHTVKGDELQREQAAHGDAASGLKDAASDLKEAAGALKGSGTESGPSTKEGFQKGLNDQVEELKRDWKSQKDFSEQIGKQNGGVQKLKAGDVNPSYEPPIPGHYDSKSQQFIPAPGRVKEHEYGMQPKTDDYDFAGQKNPAGQYQPGISAPVGSSAPVESSPVPLPQPRPPEANQAPSPPSPQSQIDGGQQIAGLSDAWQQFIDGAIAKLNGAASNVKTDQSNEPNAGGGIRGDAGDAESGKSDDIDQTVETVQSALSSLASSVQEAAGSIGSEDVQHAASGGYIRGAGTSTSDSIPAMLSDKEFVHSARATEHWGVDTMHELNSLRVPSIFQHFNLGGLASRISRSTAPVVGFASGGVARSAPSAASDAMEHWGTVDMRTDHGDYKAATERDTMRHLSANAQRAKRFSTGRKPNWYGAGQ